MTLKTQLPLTLTTLNIEELIALCKKRNQKAEFEIYRRYSRAMYNIALRIVKDEHYAEDVMQEGFLKAFTRLKDYKEEVAFGAWLKRIIINHSIDFYKKTSRFHFEALDRAIYSADHDDSEVDEINFNELKVGQVIDTIMNLKDNYRMVLTLHYIEGYDQEEIAEILDISHANCRTTLSRAKESTRKALQNLIK